MRGPGHRQDRRPHHPLAEFLQYRGRDLDQPGDVVEAPPLKHDVAWQERAIGHPLPHQALPVEGVKDAGEGGLGDARVQVQIVQAGGPHLAQCRHYLDAPLECPDRFHLVVPHRVFPLRQQVPGTSISQGEKM
jgi:hypothetical protein